MSRKTEGTSALEKEIIVINPIKKAENIKLRIAAYCRVSSDSEDQINSFSAQLEHYSKLFQENKNLEAVDIYADEGITGLSTDKREEFKRLIKDCRAGKIDKIYTKSISRFSRNTKDCLEIVRGLKRLGISIYFEKENIDTSSMTNEMILSMYSAGAQEESISVSNNMKIGCKMRMKNGTYIQPKAPIGYKIENKQLTLDEQEKETVKRIFSQYLSGTGMQKIANELNEDGIKTKSGGIWNDQGIAYVLRNEIYIGNLMFQKSFTTDVLPLKRKRNKGEKDKYCYFDIHEPIISKEEFEMAKILLEKRKSVYFRENEHIRYPFSKKITCQNCKSKFKRKEINKKVYWICCKKDKDMCNMPKIKQEDIENAFIRLYNKIRINAEKMLVPMHEMLLEIREKKNMASEEAKEINKKILEITQQIQVLNNLKTKSIIDSAFYISQTGELEGKIKSLKNKRILLKSLHENDSMIESTDKLINILKESPNYIEKFDEELFNRTVEEITAENEEEIKIKLINGLEIKEKIKHI